MFNNNGTRKDFEKLDYSNFTKKLNASEFRLIISFDPSSEVTNKYCLKVLHTLEDMTTIISSKPAKAELENNNMFTTLEVRVISKEDQNQFINTIMNLEEVLNVQTKIINESRIQSENKAKSNTHTRKFDRIKIKEKKDQRNNLTLTDCFYDWCKSVPLPRSTL